MPSNASCVGLNKGSRNAWFSKLEMKNHFRHRLHFLAWHHDFFGAESMDLSYTKYPPVCEIYQLEVLCIIADIFWRFLMQAFFGCWVRMCLKTIWWNFPLYLVPFWLLIPDSVTFSSESNTDSRRSGYPGIDQSWSFGDPPVHGNG